MKILKKIGLLCLVFILPLFTSACSKPTPPSTDTILGVLIYQNVPTNNDYETNKNNINSLVTVSNSTISTTDIHMLYFNTEDNSNSNTEYLFEDNLLFLEIFEETTEVSACLIYKDKNNNLYFSHQTIKTISADDITLFTLNNMSICISKDVSYKKG
jgi:hypothetical protein